MNQFKYQLPWLTYLANTYDVRYNSKSLTEGHTWRSEQTYIDLELRRVGSLGRSQLSHDMYLNKEEARHLYWR